MSDTMAQATADRDGGGILSFLAEAVRHLLGQRMLMPVLALLLILTVSNIIILLDLPEEGAAPSLPFLAGAFLRVGGLLVLAVAILRVATASERYPWRPDGAFWLYAIAIIVTFGIASLIGDAVGHADELYGIAIRNIVTSLVLSLFAPWVVGIAVATPLGWDPTRFLHGFDRWLPGLAVWTLLLLVPMGVAHALIDLHLIEGAGAWFWPLALLDGALSTILAALGFGLNAEAYRRVARR